jgi:hypothetical protein
MSEHDTEVGFLWGKIPNLQQLVDIAYSVKDSLSAISWSQK